MYELTETQMERVQELLDKLAVLPPARFESAMQMVSMFLDGMEAQKRLDKAQ